MAENDRKLSSFDEMDYDNSTKVLVPVIKYSNNTPEAIKENRNIPLELFYKHIFLKSEWVDYIINDPSWLRADTFSWHSGDSNEANSYVKVYDHLLNDIAGKSLISETIAGITIQYYLADDKHKICPASQENNVLSLYNSVGVAWYYIIDTTNQRFKLPRTKFGFVGVRDNVGNYVNESLPSHKHTRGTMNIVGTTNGAAYDSSTGAFTRYTRAGSFNMAGTSAPFAMSFDASLGWTGSTSNPDNTVYQDGATVQQRATQMYLYFYVGEYTMSSLENIAGQNMSIVNNKLDIDMNNINSVGKACVSNLAMPSNIVVGIALGASGTSYTPPSDGYVRIDGQLTVLGAYIEIVQNTTNQTVQNSSSNNQYVRMTVPVSKGYNFYVNYAGFSIAAFYFIYANGTK